MPTQIYVNLPVQDPERSRRFFSALGFSFEEGYSNEKAVCLVIGENIYAMLLAESFFSTFTNKPVADAAAATGVILAVSVDDRARVDELADLALRSGGSPANDPMQQGGMYSRSFHDPDGHMWEILSGDPQAEAPGSGG